MIQYSVRAYCNITYQNITQHVHNIITELNIYTYVYVCMQALHSALVR